MYYYLAASLPSVTLGDPPPTSPDTFVFQCQGALDMADWLELSLVVQGRAAEAASSFAARWNALETQLRTTVARIRAGRLGIDARPWLHAYEGYDGALEHAVADAMTRTDPLERELAMDRARWNALDDLVGADRFGFAAILAYGVKLTILERWHRMNDEEGLERIETFITDNADKSLALQRLGGT